MDKPIKLNKKDISNYWVSYFKSLLPLNEQEYLYRKDIINSLKDKRYKGNVLFICNLPLYKYTLVESIKLLFKGKQELPSFLLVSGYSLCEVWVKDLEFGPISSLTDTYKPDILLVVIENKMSRVPNKDYFSIIKQVVTEREMRGKTTWLYYMGSESDSSSELEGININTKIFIKLKPKKGGVDNNVTTDGEYIC